MATIDDILAKASAAINLGHAFALSAKPLASGLRAVFQQNGNAYPVGDFNQSGFVFFSFDGTRQYLIPEDKSDCYSAEITAAVEPVPNDLQLAFDQKKRSGFEALVQNGIDEIILGTFGKVVLSRKETVATESDFTVIFKKLLSAYPTAFRYCWFHPETGLWMGASPEQLLQTEGNEFKTVALAGTQPFVDTERVLWHEKEIAEQRFVTDFIAESLRNETSELIISEPYTARAGNLLHIKTDISGVLAEQSGLKKVLETLHPTPAVCGHPKIAAKTFILENEGYDREFYSGFLGEVSGNSSDLYVNLRCMKLDGHSADLFIGCGITRDSIPEKEFIETANKALTMKKILI